MTGPLIACYNFQERLLPALRAEVARRLAQKGMRQGRIAAHLSVSQAMVSKYLRKAARPPDGFPQSVLHALVSAAVEETLAAERRGVLPAWCSLCHRLAPPANGTGPPGALSLQECLRGEHLPVKEEADRVIESLVQAQKRMQGPDFLRLAPEVRINVAMALPDARDARGVAAFPGRLVDLKGELRAVSEPEFGASNHLAELLIRIRKSHPELRAILCLRDDETMRRALRAAGLRFRLLRRVRNELLVSLGRQEDVDALVDPGAFGFEPILYLLGDSAVTTAEKAQKILLHLPAAVSR